jgi:TRAP transporter TAXI family solute receptor
MGRRSAWRRLRGVLMIVLAIAGGACSRAAPDAAAGPTTIRFLTPTPTPAAGLSKLVEDLDRDMPHVTIALQPTTGSVVVTSAIQTGAGDFGLAQSDVVYLAYRRGTATQPYPNSNLRGVVLGAVNRVFIFVRRSGPIHTVKDLRGRKVAISPEGTAGEVLTRELLEAYGIEFSDLTVSTHQIREMGKYFQSEQLDAMIMVGTINPDTATAPVDPKDLRLIAVDGEGWSKLRAQYLFLMPATVFSREMSGLAGDVPTISAYSMVICRQDLPEELVYQFLKKIFKEAETNNALSIDSDTGPATPIPLHPGAARFYRELQLLQ